MGSSPNPEPPVDSHERTAPPANDEAAADAYDAPTRRAAPQPEAAPRHSPVLLVIDVVRILRGRGLPIAESLAYSVEAIHAAEDLLRRIGVEPNHFAPRPASMDGPALAAAATLMRAAGIEPNHVAHWPGAQR